MSEARSITHFIVQTKLGELRRQREELSREYDRIEAAARAQGSDVAGRVRALHDGLLALRFAGERVHLNLPDLEVLWRAQAAGLMVDASEWERRLEAELQRGRARTEATYLYGSILEELAGEVEPKPEAPESFLARQTEMLAPLDLSALERELDGWGLGSRAQKITRAFGEDFHTISVEGSPDADKYPDGQRLRLGLHERLWRIADDPERTRALREEATQLAPRDASGSESRLKALREALELRLRDAPASWAWPASGVAPRAVQTYRSTSP